MSDGQAPGQAAAAEKISYWEDFVDILYAPSQVFARRTNGNFWIPLLVVTALFTLLWFASTRLLEPVFDAEWDRQMTRMMEQDPNRSPEQLEAGRGAVRVIQTVGAVLIVPAAIFIVGIALWLVGKIFEAKQTLRSALVVAAFACLPRALEQAVAIIEGFFRDLTAIDGRNRLMWGVARFLDPDTVEPEVLAVLMRVDVFTIWVTVLLAIGLSVTGGISRQRAAIAGVVMWIIGAIPTYLSALAA